MRGVSKRSTHVLQGIGLGVILLVGLFLRLGTALQTQVDHPIRNDAKEYVSYAWNWKYLGVYSGDFGYILGTAKLPAVPDAIRPPGYPFLLRMLMPHYVGPVLFERVVWVQAALSELTLLLSILIGTALLGRWLGLALGSVLALIPHQSVYVAYLLSEVSEGMVLMLAIGAVVIALTRTRSRDRLGWALLAGVLFGLGCLIRQTLDQWVPALLVLCVLPAVRRYFRQIAMMFCGFVLAMLPWWSRNLWQFRRLDSPQKMVTTVWEGSYPGMMYQGRPDTFTSPATYDPATSYVGDSVSRLLQVLFSRFALHPWETLHWYVIGKIGYFFDWNNVEGWRGFFTYPVLQSPWLSNGYFVVAATVTWLLFPLLVAFGVLGSFLPFLPATRRLFSPSISDSLRFIALLHLFVIGVHVVGLPLARYAVPFQPVTFLLALFAMNWLWRAWRLRKDPLLVPAHG